MHSPLTNNVQEEIDVRSLVDEESDRMSVYRHFENKVRRSSGPYSGPCHSVVVRMYQRLIQIQNQYFPLDYACVAINPETNEQLIYSSQFEPSWLGLVVLSAWNSLSLCLDRGDKGKISYLTGCICEI